jgi:hypothetical protein
MTAPLLTAKHRVINDYQLNEPDLYKKWLHKKTGSTYWIDYVAYNEKDLEPIIIYRSSKGDGLIWARSAKEFFDGRFECTEEKFTYVKK